MTADAESDDGRDIMSKAGSIVAALEKSGELTAAQLAELVDEPVSSTYRLLQNLTGIGWIEQGSVRGRFRLGVFFIRIGAQFEDSLDVRHAALPELQRLRRETGWTAFLCFRRGTRGVCVERVDGLSVRSLAMQIGDSLPLYVGAAPVALFAFLPPGEQHLLLETFSEDRAPHTLPVPPRAELEATLAETLSRGYARVDEDVTLGIAGFARPVFNHRGELVGAISISGLREQVLGDEARLVDLLDIAATTTSRRLGYLREVSRATS